MKNSDEKHPKKLGQHQSDTLLEKSSKIEQSRKTIMKAYKAWSMIVPSCGSVLASKHHERRNGTIGVGVKELRFYVSHATEINKRFHGKHIAIIGDNRR